MSAFDVADPAAVVRALFEADARGDDPSVYATGDLAGALNLIHRVEQQQEITARAFVPTQIEVERADGERAVVRLRAELRRAVRQPDGTWKAEITRLRGRATAIQVGGRWRVADLPLGRRSFAGALFATAPVVSSGLRFEVAAVESPRVLTYWALLENTGPETLTVERLGIHVHGLRGSVFPFGHGIPRARIETGGLWADSGTWRGAFRPRRGAIALDVRDDRGVSRVVAAPIRAPVRDTPWMRIRRHLRPARVLEAVGVAWLIVAAITTFTSFVAGVLLLGAGTYRAASLGIYLMGASRGRGIAIAATLVAAELILGTVLLFHVQRSQLMLSIWAPFAAYLVYSWWYAWKWLRETRAVANDV